mgnify:CR=1 FL=1
MGDHLFIFFLNFEFFKINWGYYYWGEFMNKPKHEQQSNNQNAKDQLGDDNIVVSGNKKNSKIKA